MRFVESVFRKTRHFVENVYRHRFGNAAHDCAVYRSALVVHAAVHEDLFLSVHFLYVLFAHGAAHDVRLSEGEAAQRTAHFHDLFLIDHDAVGIGKDGLHQRVLVFDALRIVLIFDVIGNGVHRAGAVQRNARDDIFESRRTQVAHKAFHAGTFKLEHGVGIPRPYEVVRAGIFVTELVEVKHPSRRFLYVIHRLFDIGQGNEPQKVHFKHAELFDLLHVELRGDILAVSL